VEELMLLTNSALLYIKRRVLREAELALIAIAEEKQK